MNSIGRCDPVPFDIDDPDESIASDCWIRFPVCDGADGMQAFFDMFIPGESGILSLSETDTYRLLCHALVQHLPDIAFGEAFEALTGMYDFYRKSPMLPSPPSPLSTKARVTGSYAAPIFPVLEE
jgi:hypothetical protein